MLENVYLRYKKLSSQQIVNAQVPKKIPNSGDVASHGPL